MKVSIIMPAYNEEKRIGRTLEKYSEFFKNKDTEIDFLVVINATTDRTEEVVKTVQKKDRRIRYLNLKKGGKGYAVIEGFKDSLKKDFDLIGFVDADNATPPEAFYDLIANIGNADGILASRYLPGSKLYPPMTFRRTIVGKTFHSLVRILFFMPYKDTQCGAKLFSRRAAALAANKVGMTQWAFDIEMLYEIHRRGMKIKEIPTIWREVEGSKLKVVKTSIQMFLAVIQLRMIKSRYRRILKPFGKLIVKLWRAIK